MRAQFGASGVAARGSRRSLAVTAAAVSTGTMTITQKFAQLAENKQCAFVPFLCAGDPDMATTEAALRKLDALGADVIELGVPYSDPLADGPVIQESATRALKAGATLDTVLEMVSRVAPELNAPMVLFTYFNPLLCRGFEKVIKQIADAGVKGLLIPDIPLEETIPISKIAKAYGVDLVLLTTPTTTRERAVRIAEATEGFLYLVSVTGVTGVRTSVASRVEELVAELKTHTKKPICVGFGVSKGEHAAQLEGWGADGAIAGSALVRALGEAASPAEGLIAMEALAQELRDALPSRK